MQVQTPPKIKEAMQERVLEVKETLGLSGRKFGEKIGLKAGSATKLLTGFSALSKPLANSIELKFGYRAEWLLTGELPKKAASQNLLSLEDEALLEVADRETLNTELDIVYCGRIGKQLDQRYRRYADFLQKWRNAGRDDSQEFERFNHEARQQTILKNELTAKRIALASEPVLFFTASIIQALYFAEEWEGKKERSEAFAELQKTCTRKPYPHLKQHFEDTLQQFRELERGLDRLFQLSEEEEAFMETPLAEKPWGTLDRVKEE